MIKQDFISEAQGLSDTHKSINVIYHIKKTEKLKPYDHLSRGSKSFWQNSHPFMEKKKPTLQKMGIEWT